MKRTLTCGLLSCGLAALAADITRPLYECDFESVEVGKVPGDFLVLNGTFAVRADGTNKFLELPGAPLDGFAAQFGPAESTNVAVSARIYGTARGRRGPAFGVTLGGAGGYRLQVSPGRKALELFKDQELRASAAYEWQSSTWTRCRLQVCRAPAGEWRVEGRVWTDGRAEPPQWMVSSTEPEAPPPGRAGVVGSPFAGTPIRFDDLAVGRAGHP
jgi:hypothetical protein